MVQDTGCVDQDICSGCVEAFFKAEGVRKFPIKLLQSVTVPCSWYCCWLALCINEGCPKPPVTAGSRDGVSRSLPASAFWVLAKWHAVHIKTEIHALYDVHEVVNIMTTLQKACSRHASNWGAVCVSSPGEFLPIALQASGRICTVLLPGIANVS